LRRILVEEQKLEAIISLPGGVFRPYAGVSTAILVFTKTNSGGTDNVWFAPGTRATGSATAPLAPSIAPFRPQSFDAPPH
jgi:type I restriction-modification system DNA methylase subunit